MTHECSQCGAAVTNVPKHLVWHQRVDAELVRAGALSRELARGVAPGSSTVRIDRPTETASPP